MKKAVKAILNVLSYGGIEVESARRLADIKKLDPIRIFLRKLDMEIYNGDYKVPIRLFFPDEKMEEHGAKEAILFFHGGGWTTESVETYDRVCARMAQSTGQIVVSVEYRLAPEHRFPTGLEDCYAAAQAMLRGEILPEVTPENVTIMGDSAGGNLAAAVCLLARERREFMPRKQILIYPALNNCYTEESPYRSVQENGEGYLLTAVKMEDYLKLYESSPDDRQNPYFAPILEKDLSHMPDTLILTAEFDPLRDEGEAYGKRLEEAGNYVEVHRIPEALHGYFALGIRFLHVQESFEIMNKFLEKEADKTWKQDIQNGEN
jgi:acetyl esterase/lipase